MSTKKKGSVKVQGAKTDKTVDKSKKSTGKKERYSDDEITILSDPGLSDEEKIKKLNETSSVKRSPETVYNKIWRLRSKGNPEDKYSKKSIKSTEAIFKVNDTTVRLSKKAKDVYIGPSSFEVKF